MLPFGFLLMNMIVRGASYSDANMQVQLSRSTFQISNLLHHTQLYEIRVLKRTPVHSASLPSSCCRFCHKTSLLFSVIIVINLIQERIKMGS